MFNEYDANRMLADAVKASEEQAQADAMLAILAGDSDLVAAIRAERMHKGI